jgi:hypothetical protein
MKALVWCIRTYSPLHWGTNCNMVLLFCCNTRKPSLRKEIRTFEQLILSNTAFVDKSLFIKRFWEHPFAATLIAYPPKWGKSINLSMIEAFFNKEEKK